MRPSRIIHAGRTNEARNTERYEIPGRGAVLVALREGDHLDLINCEGAQDVELIGLDPHNKPCPSLFETTAKGPATGLMSILKSTHDDSLIRFTKTLAYRQIDLTDCLALNVFGKDSPAGDRVELIAQHDGFVIIATPADDMTIDGHNTASPVTAKLTRAHHQDIYSFAPPDPLADPLLDLRVHSSTARAYEIKAGDYIQILDVDGRQCTDFQCFDARKLDRGIANPLDVTTTRTLMGHAYPMPGLHAKYFDQDMDPLVEVIQDTCGRHDAFAMACAAKYYDDIGYPGHVNCTDNFNGALAPHGIDPRAGWMAINFFFNTGIDDHGVMYADQPWSRPGDYVLLRALTDLVCVSSACPDDTSPANGWKPTDIHIRSYSGSEKFSHAVAWRPTAEADPKMTKQTAFHPRLSSLTRDFVDYKGFWLPNAYTGFGAIAEYHACRQKAVVIDLSALRKFEITGPDSEALLQYCLTRNIKKLGIGQVVYSAMCYPHGGMIDDGTVLRLGQDNFRWICGDDYSGIWLREQAEKLGLQVLIRSSGDQMHNLAVQGPNSRDILRDVIWTPPHQPNMDELGWFKFTVGRIGDAKGVPVVVSRTGYTGELGYEIWCHPKHALDVWDAIWETGKTYGLTPMGLAALDMVRIEAGLIFADYEFSDQTDPFEAGIGFTVPLKSKEDDFVGRDALIRRKEHPSRKLVGLEIDGNVTVGHGDCIHIGRARIGEITSAVRSPILGKNIALARVDIAHADIGTEVEIGKLDGHMVRLPATITAFPHYDPKKEKPQS
ncbi:aminomethyltransferase family protein [Thalassospira sp. MA62]|nr:aminomethyltransferase family protein [Thalassospira sp. MA62]